MNADAPSPVRPFRVLFVCTGNTCRSPTAEALARRFLRERGWDHVTVESAGTHAFPGAPASGGALRAAARHGIDLSEHRSRPLTPEMVAGADMVLTMSPGHVARVVELGGGGRVAALASFATGPESGGSGASVPDPFGGSDEVYDETFRLLERLVEAAMGRLADPPPGA